MQITKITELDGKRHIDWQELEVICVNMLEKQIHLTWTHIETG